MKYLTVEKIHRIIDLSESLRLYLKAQRESHLSEPQPLSEKLLDSFQNFPNLTSPRYMLFDYVNNLSSEELAEAIALMLLGRGHSGEKPSDFPDLVRDSKGVVANYLVSKAPLAKYLRQGLKKLNLHSTQC